jgi:hypothetical protein
MRAEIPALSIDQYVGNKNKHQCRTYTGSLMRAKAGFYSL